VVDRVVDDVVQGLLVLLLRFDHLGPVPAAEDVVLAPMALVEGAGVAAVEVAHALVEVRRRCLDDEVVVVAEQALRVHPPAVAAHDPAEQVEEDDAVVAVDDDRRVIVPPRHDVVEGSVLERPQRASHPVEATARRTAFPPRGASRHTYGSDESRARHETGGKEPRPGRTRC
jgi:hypothetical protein